MRKLNLPIQAQILSDIGDITGTIVLIWERGNFVNKKGENGHVQ